MTREQIDRLVSNDHFQQIHRFEKVVETHISWVIICDQFVYKIKKPIRYSFLDFSTLEKRKFYCERELELNQRLTENMYLDVLPISEQDSQLSFESDEGTVVDFLVRMRKMDGDRQMDLLLQKNAVTTEDLRKLAWKMARFHQTTEIILKENALDVQEKFMDLEGEIAFLDEQGVQDGARIIHQAMSISQHFMGTAKHLLAARVQQGLFRDCHGDLHSRNIFLLAIPQPFDCLEFSDDLRQIDILNEIAFLCMDLEAFGKKSLANLFLDYYNSFLPIIRNDGERRLFLYYKSYRANIRAKVNSLRARAATVESERTAALAETSKYLQLMQEYLRELSGDTRV